MIELPDWWLCAEFAANELAGFYPPIPLLCCPCNAAPDKVRHDCGVGVKQAAANAARQDLLQAAIKSIAAPFMQYRLPVGFGPSLNTWPKCPPQSAHNTSVRG